MSEIAGKIATQAGAFILEKPLGGRGILLGGVPAWRPATVLVIGGGVVGMNAAFIAIGMEADVFVFDTSTSTACASSTSRFGGRCLHGLLLHARDRGDAAARRPRDRRGADPRRARAARDHARAAGADEARARCSSTSRSTRAAASRPPSPTTHSRSDVRGRRSDPLLRGQHARRGADHRPPTRSRTPPFPTCSLWPTTACAEAIAHDPGLAPGVNVAGGQVTNAAVAESLGVPLAPLDQTLDAVPAIVTR